MPVEPGQKFGEWTVLGLPEKPSVNKSWVCRCSCGKEGLVRQCNLVTGGSTRCRYCNRKSMLKDKSPTWKGHEGISGSMFCRMKIAAKKRNLEFGLTIEDVWELYKKQGGRCALSGLPIDIGSTRGEQYRSQATASLDRIDSGLPYLPGNVQFVHKDVNRMKSDFDQARYVEVCQAVSQWLLQRADNRGSS